MSCTTTPRNVSSVHCPRGLCSPYERLRAADLEAEKVSGTQRLRRVAVACGTQGAPRPVRRPSSSVCAGRVGWHPSVPGAAPPVGGCQLAVPPPDTPRKAGFHRGWWAEGGLPLLPKTGRPPGTLQDRRRDAVCAHAPLSPAQRNASIHHNPVALPRKTARRCRAGRSSRDPGPGEGDRPAVRRRWFLAPAVCGILHEAAVPPSHPRVETRGY
jgi:hypothetical protein